MSLFSKNSNEENYTGGKKHFTDVIKDSGPGELLLWLNPEEDFNTNSTLIVAESEEALLFKDGIIEQVFTGGKYVLSTENYPFISRIRNAFSGGISTFNCKVYFVRTAHSMEIKWGTDSPIQLRDPKLRIATSLQGRGAYKIQISDSKKFLVKLIGNNVKLFTQEEITLYFRSEFLQYIKSTIAQVIQSSDKEILGICADQVVLAEKIKPVLQEKLDDYGIKLVNFTINALDIPQNDENRQRLENAYAIKTEAEIYGQDYNRFVGREIIQDVAQNGAGGIAAAGAGIGLGAGSAAAFGGMIQQVFASNSNQQSHDRTCPKCGASNSSEAKFCSACGTKLESSKKQFCSNCGAELAENSKFCPNCGAKQQ